ncbi:MAG: PEP-CTERM sorting domain-containing protein [Leptolyngbya sp. SIO4C1]|nr:PEP-CTERM sorting domain-containing protein [Leptolyngbya sp. SIO4C1]
MAVAITRGTLPGLVAATVSVCWAVASPAAAQVTTGFTGDYAPENWQLFNGNADGSIDVSSAPESVQLTGGNQADDLNCSSTSLSLLEASKCLPGVTNWYIEVPEDSLLSFRWSYQTADSGGPGFDSFGYVIEDFPPPQGDGQPFIELIDIGGPLQQVGVTQIQVAAKRIFALQIATDDNRYGAATVIIDQFTATSLAPEPCPDSPEAASADSCPPEEPEQPEEPEEPVSVPEPTSAIALGLFGLGGWVLRRKRR